MRKLKLEELERVTVPEFKSQQKLPVCLVLDNVRSMHNVGSIFRTSDAFAIEKVVLTGITGQPPHREIEKTALGATQSVQWEYFETSIQAAEQLRNEGYKLIAIEQVMNSRSLTDFEPNSGSRYALIFGNEVNGVSEDLIQMADEWVEIPQFGTKHSFNIVVSAGIVLWDVYTKLNRPK